jgi:hypothetical protein
VKRPPLADTPPDVARAIVRQLERVARPGDLEALRCYPILKAIATRQDRPPTCTTL